MATFGKINIGALEDSQGVERIRACRFQLAEAGTVTNVSVYINGGGRNCWAAVYGDNAGAPSDLKAESGVVVVGAYAWYDFALNCVLATGWYWLCFRISSAWWKYDGGVANQEARKAAVNFPNPFGAVDGYQAREMSIHADYTPVGGGYPAPSLAKIIGRCL